MGETKTNIITISYQTRILHYLSFLIKHNVELLSNIDANNKNNLHFSELVILAGTPRKQDKTQKENYYLFVAAHHNETRVCVCFTGG